MSKNWIITWVFCIAVILVLVSQLNRDPHYIPSNMINKKVPDIKLASLNNDKKQSLIDINKNSQKIIHFWATWCMTCQIEHNNLLELIRSSPIPRVGVVYKDKPSKVITWLKRLGNPYHYTLFDTEGELAINMGVYGTPETFLIDKNGIILIHHEGSINNNIWQNKFLPKIK